jgi:hypothetical protein
MIHQMIMENQQRRIAYLDQLQLGLFNPNYLFNMPNFNHNFLFHKFYEESIPTDRTE